MVKRIWIIVVAVVIAILGAYLIWGGRAGSPRVPALGGTSAAFDPTNATYTIEGQSVTLVNGKAEAQTTTSLFGQPAAGDLNGDGKPDAAVILVQNPGGSGTFYYAAAAINTGTGAQGTNAILLGDRIAPQNISIVNGQIVANYADRKTGEPMTAPPSVGVTEYFFYDGLTLEPVPPVAGPGEHCGGNMTTAATCGAGYHCAPAPGSHLPFGDVGGTCVHD